MISFLYLTTPVQLYNFDEHMRLVESGNEETLSLSDKVKKSKKVVAVLPGEQVSMYALDLPIKNKKKLLQAIPFALENEILGEPDEQHMVLVNSGEGKKSVVAICERAVITEWLNWANEQKIRFSSLVPDFAFYPLDEDAKYHFYARDSHSACVIEDHYNRSICENSFIDHLSRSFVEQDQEEFQVEKVVVDDLRIAEKLSSVPGLEVCQVDRRSRAISDLLSFYKPDMVKPFELLVREYSQEQVSVSVKTWKIAAGIILVTGILKLGFDHYQHASFKSQRQVLLNQASTKIQAVFPEFHQVTDLRVAETQVQQALAKLKGSGSVSDELMILLAQITPVLGRTNAVLEQFDFRNGELLVSVTVPQYSQLQMIQQAVGDSGNTEIKLVSSTSSGNEVSARLSLQTK